MTLTDSPISQSQDIRYFGACAICSSKRFFGEVSYMLSWDFGMMLSCTDGSFSKPKPVESLKATISDPLATET